MVPLIVIAFAIVQLHDNLMVVNIRRGVIKLQAQDTKIREARIIPLIPAVWEMLRGL